MSALLFIAALLAHQDWKTSGTAACTGTNKMNGFTAGGGINCVSDTGASPTLTRVAKTGDETISSDNVLTNDADIAFSLSANTTYGFRCVINYTTTANADFKWRHVGPASPTVVIIKRFTNDTGAALLGEALDTAFSSADITNQQAVAFSGTILMYGLIQNGANAGSFNFAWSANTSVAENTTVHKGSWCEWMTF